MIVPAPRIVYTSKTYKSCQGTAWHGSGQCSTCGADVGSGGVCMASIEVVPEPIEEVCSLCGKGKGKGKGKTE